MKNSPTYSFVKCRCTFNCIRSKSPAYSDLIPKRILNELAFCTRLIANMEEQREVEPLPSTFLSPPVAAFCFCRCHWPYSPYPDFLETVAYLIPFTVTILLSLSPKKKSFCRKYAKILNFLDDGQTQRVYSSLHILVSTWWWIQDSSIVTSHHKEVFYVLSVSDCKFLWGPICV